MTDPLPPPPAPHSATKTIVIAAIVVVVTFVSGLLTGLVLHRYFMHARGGPRIPRFADRAMIHHLDRRLDLTDEQEARIEAIIRRRHATIEKMWRDVRPRVSGEIEAANREIEAVLTPEQREEFKKIRMRLGPPPPHERHRGRERRGSTR